MKVKTANEAFVQLFEKLYYEGQEVGPRGLKTKELTNVLIEIKHPNSGYFIDNKYHKWSEEYATAELDWYKNEGKLEDILPHSKFWAKLYPKGYTKPLNSNYGYRIHDNSFWTNKESFDQFENCISILTGDKDSRRAIINIKLPDNLEIKSEDINDIPCTQTIQFLIRDNKLNMTVTMRSNDLIFGFCYDQYYFSYLQELLLAELKLDEKFKNLELGTYTHFTASMHIYEKHWSKFSNIKTKEKTTKESNED